MRKPPQPPSDRNFEHLVFKMGIARELSNSCRILQFAKHVNHQAYAIAMDQTEADCV